jgi:pyruvate formate lyase activating enzyme
VKGIVFDIQRYSVQDGPGIRTTVFMKGCPLRCRWCANPESQQSYRQVAHSDALCSKCGDCVPACPMHAVVLAEHGIRVDRGLCDNCAKCVTACVRGAIKVYGREITLDEALDVAERDLAYYRNTGGGVTVGGGEPLAQGGFVAELLKGCKALGIHTCLDTSGLGSPYALSQVLPYTDLVYHDLKLVDPAKHRAVTGQSNDLILRNLRTVAEQRVPLVIRIPFIPGLNSSEDDIRATADMLLLLPPGRILEVDLLPYHRFGSGKYQMLDMDYGLPDLPTLRASDPEVQQAKEIIERTGLKCRIEV